MTFTVPNQSGSIEDPTGVYPQAQLDSVDLQILGMSVGGVNGVSSGCAVTAQGSPNNTVAVASGTVVVANTEAVVSAGNVTMTAAHATLARFDLITVTNAGVKTYTAGTAATTPVFPAIPASSVVLAAIYVDSNDNVINSNQIVDKRISVPVPTAIGSWTTLSKATDETRNSTTTLAVDSALKFTMAANTKYRIRGLVVASTVAAADFKWRHFGPPSPTLVGIRRVWDVIVGGATSVGTPVIDTAYSAADLTDTRTGDFSLVLAINGIVHNGSTAGDFEFKWAQNTSDAGNTTVRAGSYLDYSVA